MDRGKVIAIITGAISILIALAYLILVQLLDSRGEMIPAPVSQLDSPSLERIDNRVPIQHIVEFQSANV